MYKSLLITLMLVFSCQSAYAGLDYSIKPHKVVIDTLLLECTGEKDQFSAYEAVAEVIKNRARQRLTSEYQVCLQRKQFSCWNDKKEASKRLAKIDKCPELREMAVCAWYTAQRENNTNGATHYANLKLCSPKWASKMIKTVKIGQHTFFREK